jgi:DNA-binding protein H-NS
MAQTYIQLMQQIDKLQKQAQDLRKGEIDGVVRRIREAITAYSLTAEDLGLAGLVGQPAAPAATKAPAKARVASTTSNGAGPALDFPTNKGKAVKGVKAPKARKTRKSKGPKAPAAPKVVKFRNDTGGTWGGLGKRPDWLRAALAAGKQLSDFAVK